MSFYFSVFAIKKPRLVVCGVGLGYFVKNYAANAPLVKGVNDFLVVSSF